MAMHQVLGVELVLHAQVFHVTLATGLGFALLAPVTAARVRVRTAQRFRTSAMAGKLIFAAGLKATQ